MVWNVVRKKITTDMISLAKVIAPNRMLAPCHIELANFMIDPTGPQARLGLIPRGHQKSWLAALRAVLAILRDPTITILYLSATSPLALAQLEVIKLMLEHEAIKHCFPELLHPKRTMRTQWNTKGIKVDHPARITRGIREETVKAAGLTTNITGTHFDLIILDDLVVPENNTPQGRTKVESYYSQLWSILNPGGQILGVGTRYHPKDIYSVIKDTKEDIYDDKGEIVGRRNTWGIHERVVEVNGEFLWPRKKSKDGKAYGFDFNELGRIRSNYTSIADFNSQYYNNPNETGASSITYDMFKYYDRDKIKHEYGKTFAYGEKLAVYAAVDFAYATTQDADFTTIAVVGVTANRMYYLLDIVRFKSKVIKEFKDAIKTCYTKWRPIRIRAETNAAQDLIVEQIKAFLREDHVNIPLHGERSVGNKHERIIGALGGLYEEGRFYHYAGGHAGLLEEELTSARPAHDDIMDSLACAVTTSVPPAKSYKNTNSINNKKQRRSRFGG